MTHWLWVLFWKAETGADFRFLLTVEFCEKVNSCWKVGHSGIDLKVFGPTVLTFRACVCELLFHLPQSLGVGVVVACSTISSARLAGYPPSISTTRTVASAEAPLPPLPVATSIAHFHTFPGFPSVLPLLPVRHWPTQPHHSLLLVLVWYQPVSIGKLWQLTRSFVEAVWYLVWHIR